MFGQDVHLLVNCKEVVSVSQLVDMLAARIPWGSRQRTKLVWRNMNDTYQQIEHSHELQMVWECCAADRKVKVEAMIDDMYADAGDLAARASAPREYGPIDADLDKFSIRIEVDSYMAKLDEGVNKPVSSCTVEITVDSKNITLDEMREMIGKEISIGPKQMAKIRWWHHKKQQFIDVLDTEDLMQIMRRKKRTRKVFFLGTISDVVEQVIVDVDAPVVAEQNEVVDVDEI